MITIEEFNCKVPLIDHICNSVINAWTEIMRLRNKLIGYERAKNEDMNEQEMSAIVREEQEAKEDLNKLIERANEYIREIETLGGFVAEMAHGTVTFPFEYNSVKRFICYRPGDNGAEFFINIDETPGQRRRIL